MSDLQNEIDRFSYRSDAKEEEDDATPPPPPPEEREPSPPPLPPPLVCGTPPTREMHYGKPSLPEPNCPPPPPPVQNGYAFNTPILPPSHAPSCKKPKEPIYESIKPRPDPLGGSGDEGNQVGTVWKFDCHLDFT